MCALTPVPRQTGPPWNATNTKYFYGGWLSAFAPTPGLWLPVSYYGRKESELVLVRALENWFQATKATSRQEFDRILVCPTPAAAKRAGRQTELRPDWEDIKFDVMVFGQGGKFTLEPYRAGLLLTHPRPLAEDSPTDFVWGCRDPEGGHGGENLLGVALMQVRAELAAGVQARLAALSPGR
jgi:ribA/ribD-fused uncharacterized protein